MPNQHAPAAPLAERFWAKVARGSTSECWLWLGGISSTGYGSIKRSGGARITAHRASWELHRGPVPDGLWVLHRCDVRRCVNPAHLFLGTRLDNIRDMDAKGRRSVGFRHGLACERARTDLPDANGGDVRARKEKP